ncbi:MAG TPA: ectonucleotide pyrophosphatase/phosphodiesterase [Terracidiphilus sp.]
MRVVRAFRAIFAAVLLAALLPALPAQTASPISVLHVEHGPNSAAAQAAHYVVLVSLDGFRWDYAERDHAEHLLALGKRGAWAPEGMLPSYPSLTFPNHFTIVTGLYPEHHGLVANSFFDPATQKSYALRDQQAVADGSWYSGVPLWSLAESQGMRAACLFWPGSEAEIAGYRPTYYAHFDDKTDEHARINLAVEWLKLPPDVRPHFITIYFSDVDHAGHSFGPDAPETHEAIRHLDAIVGELQTALDATGLPIDLVVVSDHGMVKVDPEWITLDKFADLSGFKTEGPLLYGATEADRARVYGKLKKASSQFVVYRRKNVPRGLHFDENPREGDPIVIPTGPYAMRAHGPEEGKVDKPPLPGNHGYDPHKMPEMKASFFAAGPDVAVGRTVAPFENVNLYPWIAHLLGLTAPRSDGSLNVLAGILREGAAEARTRNEE